MNQVDQYPLKQLAIADPGLADAIAASWQSQTVPLPTAEIVPIADQILWGLSQAESLGRAIAKGYADLLGVVDREALQVYRQQVQQTGQKGVTLGTAMATHLAVVLQAGDARLAKRFLATITTMMGKGTYTLKKPLEALTSILTNGDFASAFACLELFSVTFAQAMTYNQSLNLTYILPKAVLSFHPERRPWQIEALAKVVKVDFRLAEPFLEGLIKGLDLLAQKQLNRFVSQGLEKYSQNKTLGSKFLALESKLGLDTCQAMQVTVPLDQVRSQLNRYLKARTGLAISVRPISEASSLGVVSTDQPCVCSDGRYIYLSDEIGHFPEKESNQRLYKLMTRLETGYYEFDTFAFDLEKALELIETRGVPKGPFRQPMATDIGNLDPPNEKHLSDLEHFFRYFPNRDLAADLFTIFEHGRLRIHHSRRYPGLVRQVYPSVIKEARRLIDKENHNRCLMVLYAWIALGVGSDEIAGIDPKIASILYPTVRLLEDRMQQPAPVEVSAELVWWAYSNVAELLGPADLPDAPNAYEPLTLPFGRCLRPDLVNGAQRQYDQLAAQIKRRIEQKGLKIYKADIRQHLLKNDGRVSVEDLETLTVQARSPAMDSGPLPTRAPIDLSWLDLSDLLGCDGITDLPATGVNGPTFRYAEWDCRLTDYLDDHVQVIEKPIPVSAHEFYDLTLRRYSGLVKQIHRAFELLKPEGFKVLRQWLEGDDFDYRALLDYVVERRAKRMPSERLYIKRVKAQRDVAALLLVDLSRSTANPAYGSRSRVIDIEKEAIVLLCEALEVVGDAYAIAGFSGTGRLGVDYFRIKDFEDPLDDDVRGRIQAMAPHRSTRMGAAIRHATGIIGKVPAKVRLLIVLGDGFPNDVDYKKKYAIEDTSKAIYEARAKSIHVKGITVNLAGDGRLDEVYGNFHHTVISDVRELPDKLLRIYGTVTR